MVKEQRTSGREVGRDKEMELREKEKVGEVKEGRERRQERDGREGG